MKIELKDITISSFLNIAEEQTVTFDGPGIYAVIGENKDDGGSNGSGKSSLLRALTVLPQGSKYVDITNKEIKNRILGLPARVSGNYIINNKTVNINRIIGGKLTITVDGVELDGKTDEIQSKFVDLMGISPEHYIHLTHKMQEDFGGFLLMKDSEKKDFLGSFFDTSKIDNLNENNSSILTSLNKDVMDQTSKLSALTGKISVLKTDIDALLEKSRKFSSHEFTSTLSNYNEQLLAKKHSLQHLESTDIDMLISMNPEYIKLKSQLDSANIEYQTASAGITDINNDMDSRVRELVSMIESADFAQKSIPSDLKSELDSIQKTITENQKKQLLIYNITNSLKSQTGKIDGLKLKISSLKPNSCSTCGQSVNEDVFTNIKNQFESELNAVLAQTEDMIRSKNESESSLVDESVLGTSKSEIESKIASYKAGFNKESMELEAKALMTQISSNRISIDLLDRTRKQLDISMSSLKKQTESKLTSSIQLLKHEIATLTSTIESLTKESSIISEYLDAATGRYNESTKELNILDSKLKTLTSEIILRSKLSEILSRNGFIGYIFDTVLEEINQEVNENIKDLTVISRFSMYFTPDHVAKTTGNVSKSITYKIFDKNEEVSFSTLSGSEKESLLIAVDAAVDTVLCRRLGVDINYKILDEQFGWVDGVHKEPILEFIKNKYHDKIVLIVDHGSELNAAIDKKILITKQNGMATISCQNLN